MGGEGGSAVPTAVCKMHTAKERGVLIFVKRLPEKP